MAAEMWDFKWFFYTAQKRLEFTEFFLTLHKMSIYAH